MERLSRTLIAEVLDANMIRSRLQIWTGTINPTEGMITIQSKIKKQRKKIWLGKEQ